MFYDNLKAACEKNGLKITPIVAECGGAKGSISNWKKGAIPNSDIVMKLSVRLNVSTDYLLFGIDSNVNQLHLSENEHELTDIEKKLLKDFRSLSQQGQDYIRQQMFMAREVYKNNNLPQSNLNAG